jgi:SAM-dependent methyltransferase
VTELPLALLLALAVSVVAATLVLRLRRSQASPEEIGGLGPIPQLPLPPLELRELVGPTEPRFFDNPNGGLAWGDLAIGPLVPGQGYRRIFDFGCGCGRSARQLLLQNVPPDRYVGIDINRPMIDWCRENLKRRGVDVSFHHHDVWSATYAPTNSRNEHLPIRHHGKDFTLINAHSVFTHLLEGQTRFYLREMREILTEDGLLRCSWFFFNRHWFPVLAPNQHCLYVNERDPTQAVYYDWSFFRELVQELNFKIVDSSWTQVSGFQSFVLLAWGEKFEDLSADLEPPEDGAGIWSQRADADDTTAGSRGSRPPVAIEAAVAEHARGRVQFAGQGELGIVGGSSLDIASLAVGHLGQHLELALLDDGPQAREIRRPLAGRVTVERGAGKELHERGLAAAERALDGKLSLDEEQTVRPSDTADAVESEQWVAQVVEHAQKEDQIEESVLVGIEVVDVVDEVGDLASDQARCDGEAGFIGIRVVEADDARSAAFQLEREEAVSTADVEGPQPGAVLGKTQRFEVPESPLGVVYSGRHHPRRDLDPMVPVNMFPYYRLRERGIRDLLAFHG